MLRHVVLWKFRDDADPEEFLRRLAALEGVIPGLLAMQVRRSAVPGAQFDAALIADFASPQALERYRDDPRHREVSALCRAIRVARSAIDFEL